MSRTPTLAEAIQTIIANNLQDLRISLPARVERYDATLQQIDVQPLIKEAYQDEANERVSASLPVICNVPLIFPGMGPYRVTFPVNVGDTVLILFSASSLDVWLSEDGLVDPIDDRRFSLSDAVAIPGLRSFKNPLTSADENKMTLGHDEGSQIFLEEDAIRLNSATGKLIAIAEKVEDELSAIKAAYNLHTHADPVSGTTGPASNLLGVGFPSSVAADGVFAKD